MRSKLLIGALGAAVAFLLATNPVIAEAAGRVTSADIVDNTITGKDVKNNNLTGKDIKESKLGVVPKAKSAVNSYTKAETDNRYARSPGLIRGTYALGGPASASSQPFADSIAFGWTLSAEPTPHYILTGDPVPAGCSGTVAAPNAQPGHLCIFERTGVNVGSRTVDNAMGISPNASVFGANVWAYSSGVGNVFVYGSWALRPVALTTSAPRSHTGTGPRTGQ
jgi:hypothetical protein